MDEPALNAILEKLDLLLRQAGPAPRFLSIASAAQFASLSEDSIRRLLERSALTAYRPVKGKVLIDRCELEQLILGSTTTPRTGRGIRSPVTLRNCPSANGCTGANGQERDP